jgi:hypothetical protein
VHHVRGLGVGIRCARSTGLAVHAGCLLVLLLIPAVLGLSVVFALIAVHGVVLLLGSSVEVVAFVVVLRWILIVGVILLSVVLRLVLVAALLSPSLCLRVLLYLLVVLCAVAVGVVALRHGAVWLVGVRHCDERVV